MLLSLMTPSLPVAEALKPLTLYAPECVEGVFLGSLYPAFCKERLVGSTEEPFAPLLCIYSQRYMCYSCMIIRPGEWDGKASAEVEDSRRKFASLIRRTSSSCHLSIAKEPDTGNPRTFDTS
jgi:hypothetical protein